MTDREEESTSWYFTSLKVPTVEKDGANFVQSDPSVSNTGCHDTAESDVGIMTTLLTKR